MSHWRTSRAIVGGDQSPGSPVARDTQRDYVLELVQRNMLEAGEPLIHPFELGSHLLFLALLLLPLAIVGGVVVGYLTFGTQSVEYQRGVEAYRLKGH